MKTFNLVQLMHRNCQTIHAQHDRNRKPKIFLEYNDKTIGHVKEFPMKHFGIPLNAQSMIPRNLFEYFWNIRPKLHCGNAVNVSYGQNTSQVPKRLLKKVTK